jgi:hypothetical protein
VKTARERGAIAGRAMLARNSNPYKTPEDLGNRADWFAGYDSTLKKLNTDSTPKA